MLSSLSGTSTNSIHNVERNLRNNKREMFERAHLGITQLEISGDQNGWFVSLVTYHSEFGQSNGQTLHSARR